jgi:hypothetical protein
MDELKHLVRLIASAMAFTASDAISPAISWAHWTAMVDANA